MTSALEHALTYASWGWRVCPIPPGYKHPRRDRWQQDATTDPQQIHAWWTQPGAWLPGVDPADLGVSIVTGAGSGVFVLDVDPRHDGDETLADLEHEHGPLPDTIEVLTGGGGRHLYFALPAGVTITNDTGRRLGPGLDIRGDGGQVVAPPTVHPDTGARYEWEALSDPHDGIRPALPPAWLVELLTADLEPPRPIRPPIAGTPLSDRPGDRFDATTQWADLLTADGWTLHSTRHGRTGTYELWTRPGKNTADGASASLYYQGSDVLKIFTTSIPQLPAGTTWTKFGYWTAMHHGGDYEAAARAAAERLKPTNVIDFPRPADTSDDTSDDTGDSQRPGIVHNGRQLDTVLADAIAALDHANQPPRWFVRGGRLVRLRADEDQRPLIEELRVDTTRNALAEAATWWRALKDGGLVASQPPADVAAAVLAAGDWPHPPLAGVVELPVLRPDGTFHLEHGYDPATRLYHWHRAGDPYPQIPPEPTSDDLAAAVARVDDILCDFTWDTTADRANAWGFILTPLIRPLVNQVPMALIDAPEPGTGKGLLVTICAILATGRPAPLLAWPAHDEELEKKVTAALMSGATTIVFDNVEGAIRSGTLAAVLTSDAWQGRVLGRSEMVTVPNRATWAATGNNIDVGGDLARRCYRIRLDARQARPWQRTGFRHPNLQQYVTTQRTEILAALCTIVRSWWTAGQPLAASIAAMGGYTGWVRTVGGILEHAGVTGFLANLDAFHATADREALAWEAFLLAWSENLGEQPVTTAELINRMRDQWGGPLREALPDDLATYVDSPSFAKRLGRALRARSGRHYGDSGIHVTEMPRDRRAVAIWAVTKRSVRLFDDQPDDQATADSASNTTDSATPNLTNPRSGSPVPGQTDATAGFAGFDPVPTREEIGEQQKTGVRGPQTNPRNPQTRAPADDPIGEF